MESSSAIATYIPHKSKRGVFSSSSCAEPDVIEIAPPLVDRTAKMKDKGKQKEVVHHEIIDVDMYDDCNDVVLLEGFVESKRKRKRSMGISLGPSSAVKLDSKEVESNKKGKEILIEPSHFPKGFNPGSNNFFDLDDYVYDDDNPTTPFVTSSSQWESKNTSAPGPSTYADPKHVPGQIGSSNSLSNNSKTQVGKLTSHVSRLAKKIGNPSGIKPPSGGRNSSMKKHMKLNESSGTGGATVNGPSSVSSSPKESSSSSKKLVDGDVQKRYESFKRFDTVVDHYDHYFLKQYAASTQPPKNWAKKIQQEWRILEKDLPDTIFVRVYESRMDLLRAVIIGAEGTPYHDGLFFFDVCFPSSYPNTPPLVHYHSGGLRINPNLYNCGKVCLSLLNTWTGQHKEEKWLPGTSTMLQVLVSIQGLILNAKPYFNEPGYAHTSGSSHGEKSSLHYNEKTLILSLKTMVYTMKKPPKHFEDLVIGHFHYRVHDILMACKAYTEGVQVGSLAKGGVQDVDEGNNSCSTKFKNDVASYIKTLIAAFKKIGAKEAQNFSFLSAKKNSQLSAPTTTPFPLPLPLPFPHANVYNPTPVLPVYSKHW